MIQERRPRSLLSPASQLFLCGVCTLFWELALIRWLGSSIRVVAYYSNFVLIAAFFGLGAGALQAGRRIRLERLIFPALAAIVLLGAYLGGFYHRNPSLADEYIWLGAAPGVVLSDPATTGAGGTVSLLLTLTTVYVGACAVFLIFGQWIGRLFREIAPLKAYSIEILGSVCGILLFAALSYLGWPPVAWFAVGFLLLLLPLERRALDWLVACACAAGVIVAAWSAGPFLWSPYYKIQIEPLTRIVDKDTGRIVTFDPPAGHALTVNNDYHQMMLDLRRHDGEHPFMTSWRLSYDHPYGGHARLPPGPVLVVGAGTGNDVSAALRNTDRRIDAVEIDPVIARLGRDLHPERPYQDPRVTLIVDDARSFFHRTRERYALIVFGFLDSHTLFSSFSSLRLDNFVYTRESFQQAKRLLLPGGKVQLTFASNTPWIHQRLVGLLDSVFDHQTAFAREPIGYANGLVYTNGKALSPGAATPTPVPPRVVLPTDDWPFLYLRRPAIPLHYALFMLIALVVASSALLLLPRGSRRIRLPYFCLGAAFFLIETSNVISLSLLYGSTWYVNVLVFVGILVLILLGNWVSHVVRRPRLDMLFALLAASVYVSYAVPTSALLSLPSWPLRPAAAVAVFLGPAFFASLVFATLIRSEPRLDQAYGSNVLGAVVGGICEYASLVYGFKFLQAVTLGFYLATFLLLRRAGPDSPFR